MAPHLFSRLLVFALTSQICLGHGYAATPLVMSEGALPFEYDEFLKSSSRFVSLADSVREVMNSNKPSPELLSWIQRTRKACLLGKKGKAAALTQEVVQMVRSKDWNKAERFELREFTKSSGCFVFETAERDNIEAILGKSSAKRVTIGDSVLSKFPMLYRDDAVFLNGRELTPDDWSAPLQSHGRLRVVSNRRADFVVQLGTAPNDIPMTTPFAKGSCAAPWFDNESMKGDYAVFFSPNCVWSRTAGKWALMNTETEDQMTSAKSTAQRLELPQPLPAKENSDALASKSLWVVVGAVVLGAVAYGLISQNQRKSDSNSGSNPGSTGSSETIVRR